MFARHALLIALASGCSAPSARTSTNTPTNTHLGDVTSDDASIPSIDAALQPSMDAAFAIDAAVDPCANVTCDQPPANSCADPMTLHEFAKLGSCDHGVCSYPSTNTTCACANDACSTDPCAGIDCSQPPHSFCINRSTVRSWSNGVCLGGMCVYRSQDTPCAAGCSQGVCN